MYLQVNQREKFQRLLCSPPPPSNIRTHTPESTLLAGTAPHYLELVTTHPIPFINPVLGLPTFFLDSLPLRWDG